MRLRILTAASFIAGLFSLGAMQAGAATVGITGNETRVEVTADLAGLGLDAVPFGSASADTSGEFPVFAFPITGGSVDQATGDALIFHFGSGLTLSGGGVTATVGNFVIDTVAALVSGDLIDEEDGGSLLFGIPLFDFGTDTSRPGVELVVGAFLGEFLAANFGPDLTGATFGFASPDVTVAAVPLPAAGLLLVGGIGAIGALRAGRKRAA